MLRVFNFDKTKVVSEIIFHGTGDFLNWFAFENVATSCPWILPTVENYDAGTVMSIHGNYDRSFYINQ